MVNAQEEAQCGCWYEPPVFDLRAPPDPWNLLTPEEKYTWSSNSDLDLCGPLELDINSMQNNGVVSQNGTKSGTAITESATDLDERGAVIGAVLIGVVFIGCTIAFLLYYFQKRSHKPACKLSFQSDFDAKAGDVVVSAPRCSGGGDDSSWIFHSAEHGKQMTRYFKAPPRLDLPPIPRRHPSGKNMYITASRPHSAYDHNTFTSRIYEEIPMCNRSSLVEDTVDAWDEVNQCPKCVLERTQSLHRGYRPV